MIVHFGSRGILKLAEGQKVREVVGFLMEHVGVKFPLVYETPAGKLFKVHKVDGEMWDMEVLK